MSEIPTPPPQIETLPVRMLNFVKRVGAILGISLGIVAVVAIALGQFTPFGLSNMLFWATLVVLGLATWPAVSELGATASAAGRLIVKRGKTVQETVDRSRAQREKWIGASLVYGAAGVVMFILSLAVATVFAPR